MTTADTRAALAAALSIVDGLSGYSETPSAPNVGDAWPQWRGAERAGGHAYTHTWNVLIVLPQQDEVTADSYIDEHYEELDAALGPVLFIDAIQPAEIAVPDNPQPLLALLITGRSE